VRVQIPPSAPSSTSDPSAADGPFVAQAVLCQRVDRQPDGSIDVIGIVDGVVLERDPDVPPGQPTIVPLLALVSLRAGRRRGWHELRVRGRYPSGEAGPSMARRVEFTDAHPAATFSVPIELEVDEPGTYWFDLECDGRLLSRILLVVDMTPRPK
jgi:Family of unknown function (DUF6941)